MVLDPDSKRMDPLCIEQASHYNQEQSCYPYQIQPVAALALLFTSYFLFLNRHAHEKMGITSFL